MRTLCLHFSNQAQDLAALAEVFVALSPRVQARDPDFIFADIESTAGLLGGEHRTLELARQLATSAQVEVKAAIADHPAVAQALLFQGISISPAGEDQKTLGQLAPEALLQLEGLKEWPQRRHIEHVIGFFKMLGVHSLQEIFAFPQSHFRERWGDLGITLWKRLHAQDEQVISPLIPEQPFTAYRYFDNPISMSDLLMTEIHPSLQFLFLRLSGLGRFARRLDLIFHCEYSSHRHAVAIEPVSPNRDQKLFEDLLSQKLDNLDLENPIREFEAHLFDVPEKIQQMDFFEPRDASEDRWQRLISFAKQGEIEMGFLEPLPKHFPEESFHLKADWPEILASTDFIERDNEAIQIKSVYAKNLMNSPRPTLLLKKPQLLSRGQLKHYRKMTFFPSERIQASWWARLQNPKSTNRDYYFALSLQGELVWIYQERESKEFYLHGYFD